VSADEPVRVDVPVAGLYAMRLAKGGILVAVRIWHGLPIVDGEELDRSPRWCVEIDGKTDRLEKDEATGYRCRVPLDIGRAWPFCSGRPIAESEYQFLKARAAWAKDHAPAHPAAKPREAVNVRALPPLF